MEKNIFLLGALIYGSLSFAQVGTNTKRTKVGVGEVEISAAAGKIISLLPASKQKIVVTADKNSVKSLQQPKTIVNKKPVTPKEGNTEATRGKIISLLPADSHSKNDKSAILIGDTKLYINK